MKKQHRMQCYAAPLEGITGYIYRNAHHKFFGGADKYFTPFITPKPKKGLNTREKNDILPEHNKELPVVPQILTNKAEDFIKVAQKIEELGYKEVNLNLGCPSGTVVSKKKGSGFLSDLDGMKNFFDEVFSKVNIDVSVKTRLGMDEPGEIKELIALYNQFPISEVIIHARVREDYYKKPVNHEAFAEGFSLSEHPVCYNGDIFTAKDAAMLTEKFPEVSAIMVGRGMIANPQLTEIFGCEMNLNSAVLKEIVCVDRLASQTDMSLDSTLLKEIEPDYVRWKAFLDELCFGYEHIMSGGRNVLFKLKEVWSYMIPFFPESERYGKKIKKAKTVTEYQAIVNALFREVGVH